MNYLKPFFCHGQGVRVTPCRFISLARKVKKPTAILALRCFKIVFCFAKGACLVRVFLCEINCSLFSF